MLRTRPVMPRDIDKIRKVHERWYPDLEMPDFDDMFSAFIIEDENNEMIMAGGVQMLAEALLVTDKNKSRIKIGKALVVAQGACLHTCQEFGIKELLALVDNEDYARHLIRHGFVHRDQLVLSLGIPDGQEEN
jgi:hypothetical protein